MAVSPFEDNSNLSLTERNLFSLFARYPEITFDPEARLPAKQQDRPKVVLPDLNSSPTSTLADEGNKSHLSSSTPHTTPLRPLYLSQHQRSPSEDTVAGYLRRVRHSDLPEACRLCFTSLAQSIGAISAGMIPSTNGRYRINNTYFMDQCSVLLRELQMLTTRTKDQLKQVEYLKSLIIFKAKPTDDMLWSMYRQRALLVVRLTALPSASELRLINSLALLYHASVYHPTQLLYDDNEIEPPTINILNLIYDNLFTWLSDYRQWCNAMKDLKQQYISPLVERILASKSVCEDAKSMQRAKGRAEDAIRNPVGPSMLPMDERTINALNLSARRRDVAQSKKKTRFRREKTI